MSHERYKSIVFLGAPGTGKGTQGSIIAQVPGFYHLSTGDMFRALDKDSDLGKEFLKYSTQGLLVPDEFTVRLWAEHMQGQIEAGAYHPTTEALVLDGIPRTAKQTKLLEPHVDVMAVIYLTCKDEEELVRRLQKRAQTSGRPDDAKEEVVRKRLDVYKQETRPVLDQYDPSLVAEVDAVGSPAEVLAAILNVIAPLQARAFENPLDTAR